MAAVVAEFELAAAAEPYRTDIALPPTRFVSNGDIPADSELLAVALNRMWGVSLTGGMPNEEVAALQCVNWRAASYEIVLMRCAPTPDEHPYEGQPTVNYSLVEESARQVMRDGQIMTRGIVRAYRADAFGVGPNLALEDWASVVSEGGLVGGRLLVRIGLL
jgi:hypothetical protein